MEDLFKDLNIDLPITLFPLTNNGNILPARQLLWKSIVFFLLLSYFIAEQEPIPNPDEFFVDFSKITSNNFNPWAVSSKYWTEERIS